MPTMNQYQAIAQAFFKDADGQPFKLTKGQSYIFQAIYDPKILRAAIATVTQYGKSDTASQAILYMMAMRQEKVLLVAPSAKQAGIIMGYIIDHLFDHPYLRMMIDFSGSLEKLRQERSKSRITLTTGSEVMILTADARTVSREANNVMGFGATTVILDESALLPDAMFSRILRMVGGHKRGKLVQIGNPFDSGHFKRAFQSERYTKLVIDYKQAIAEGRLTEDFIEEARDEMGPTDFRVFYEVKFPVGGAEDSLIPLNWIEAAVNQDVGGNKRQAGLDVARFGRDKTVYALRQGGKLLRLEETSKMDTMEVVGWVSQLLDEDKPEIMGVDVIGIGAGVYDRLEELKYPVSPVNVGESPSDDENKEKFYNLRAEVYWNLRQLFRLDGAKSLISIPDNHELKRQLVEIRYKYSSEKKIRIEAKDDMKKRLGYSPDYADAVAIAFYDLTVDTPEIMMF